MGATFDTELIFEVGKRLLAAEAKLRGASIILAPTVNIQRVRCIIEIYEHFHHFLSQRSISALSKVGIQLWCHHGLSRAWPYQPIDEISLEDYHDDDESSEVEDEPLFSDSLSSDGEFDAKGFSYDTFPLPDKMVEVREGELLRVFKNIQEWMG